MEVIALSLNVKLPNTENNSSGPEQQKKDVKECEINALAPRLRPALSTQQLRDDFDASAKNSTEKAEGVHIPPSKKVFSNPAVLIRSATQPGRP
jgi:hypothetical protein